MGVLRKNVLRVRALEGMLCYIGIDEADGERDDV